MSGIPSEFLSKLFFCRSNPCLGIMRGPSSRLLCLLNYCGIYYLNGLSGESCSFQYYSYLSLIWVEIACKKDLQLLKQGSVCWHRITHEGPIPSPSCTGTSLDIWSGLPRTSRRHHLLRERLVLAIDLHLTVCWGPLYSNLLLQGAWWRD